MNAPSPNPELVSSAYRPLPEGPSYRWRRAAEGLRWMRLAMYVSLGAHTAATLTRAAATVAPGLMRDISLLPGSLIGAVNLLANLALALGLWRYGDLPRSTGATRPARASFAFFAAALGVSVLGGWLSGLLMAHAGMSMTVLGGVFLLRGVLSLLLHGAYLVLLVRALGVGLRAVGEALPGWATGAVTAFIAWKILSIPLQNAVMAIHRAPLGHVWILIALAADVVFALALARLLRRTEAVIARQESPEPSPRIQS